jgi:hypothetical protein
VVERGDHIAPSKLRITPGNPTRADPFRNMIARSLSASDGPVDASLLQSERQFRTQLQMIQTQVKVAGIAQVL